MVASTVRLDPKQFMVLNVSLWVKYKTLNYKQAELPTLLFIRWKLLKEYLNNKLVTINSVFT